MIKKTRKDSLGTNSAETNAEITDVKTNGVETMKTTYSLHDIHSVASIKLNSKNLSAKILNIATFLSSSPEMAQDEKTLQESSQVNKFS